MSTVHNICKALTNKGLSPSSVNEYSRRINKFIKIVGLEDQDILKKILESPDKYATLINKSISNIKTRKNMYAVILTIFKYMSDELTDADAESINKWKNNFKACDDILTKEVESNKPTIRQQDNHVTFQDIITARDNLQKGSIEKLLLCMYTMIPPMRSDYGCISIIKSGDEQETNNFLLIEKNKYVLCVTKYKTSKFFGDLIQELPKELVAEIKASLISYPRNYLFSKKNGLPYDNIQFNAWVNRTLKHIFNKPVTINTIRHSYISSIDMNNISIEDRKDIARRMGHNWIQQEKYKLIFDST